MEDSQTKSEEPKCVIKCFQNGREVSEDEVRRLVVRAAVRIFMKKMGYKVDLPDMAKPLK
ncbi:MAG: hypothetical protein M0Z41_08525 [Peptococcaceae bacterium]|nr:hypothetical protein [Peptococcaceae bacterium]